MESFVKTVGVYEEAVSATGVFQVICTVLIGVNNGAPLRLVAGLSSIAYVYVPSVAGDWGITPPPNVPQPFTILLLFVPGQFGSLGIKQTWYEGGRAWVLSITGSGLGLLIDSVAFATDNIPAGLNGATVCVPIVTEHSPNGVLQFVVGRGGV